MNEIEVSIIFFVLLIAVISLTMYWILKKPSDVGSFSKGIITKFEPDNTAPKLTDMIDFHKVNKTSHYNVKKN